MRELDALGQLGMALDPPTDTPSDGLRRRVLTATAGQPRRPGIRLPRLALSRPGWRFAVAGGLAAVLTAGVLVTQVLPFGDRPPASTASAADILRAAAAQARSRSNAIPRDDQFIYRESIFINRSSDIVTATKVPVPDKTASPAPATASPNPARWTPLLDVQIHAWSWVSVDGTRDGLSRTEPNGATPPMPDKGCRPGMTWQDTGVMWAGEAPDAPCKPRRAYQDDLPTDPDAMLTYLYKDIVPDSPSEPEETRLILDLQAFRAASDLLHGPYLPPAVTAAIFEAVAKIPGVVVGGTAKDLAGRQGISVSRTQRGFTEQMIFDPRTHEYLGTDRYALLKVGVVDQVGQQP